MSQIKTNQMNNMNENNNIKAQVLDQIKTGKINMRPRFYFILQVVTLMVVAFIILLISSFLVSFIIFSIVESGRMFMLGFGFRGFFMFFLAFPWFILLIEVILIAILEQLLKHFKFGYRTSLAVLVLIIFCASIGLSIIIEYTPIHPTLLRSAEHKTLPFFGGFYRSIHRPSSADGFIRGSIFSIGTSSFLMIQVGDSDDGSTSAQTTNIILPNAKAISGLSVGDMVLVVGEQFRDHQIHAFGIQKLPSLPPEIE